MTSSKILPNPDNNKSLCNKTELKAAVHQFVRKKNRIPQTDHMIAGIL